MKDIFMKKIGALEKGYVNISDVSIYVKWHDGETRPSIDDVGCRCILMNQQLTSLARMEFEFYHSTGAILYDLEKLKISHTLSWYHKNYGTSSQAAQISIKLACDEFATIQMCLNVNVDICIPNPTFADITKTYSDEFNPSLLDHIYENELREREIRRRYVTEMLNTRRNCKSIERKPLLSIKERNEIFNKFNALAGEFGYTFDHRTPVKENKLVEVCRKLKISGVGNLKFGDICKKILSSPSTRKSHPEMIEFLEENYDKFKRAYQLSDIHFYQKLIEDVLTYHVIKNETINEKLINDVTYDIKGVRMNHRK